MVDLLVDYGPSSKRLEGVNDNLKKVIPLFTIRPLITLVQMLEAHQKAKKFKEDTVGKVDDAKDEVADTAKDAGKKIKNLFVSILLSIL